MALVLVCGGLYSTALEVPRTSTLANFDKDLAATQRAKAVTQSLPPTVMIDYRCRKISKSLKASSHESGLIVSQEIGQRRVLLSDCSNKRGRCVERRW